MLPLLRAFGISKFIFSVRQHPREYLGKPQITHNLASAVQYRQDIFFTVEHFVQRYLEHIPLANTEWQPSTTADIFSLFRIYKTVEFRDSEIPSPLSAKTASDEPTLKGRFV
jgi:hypothetical protein